MAKRGSIALVPAPDRASDSIVTRCREQVEGRAKRSVRKLLLPYLRRRLGLAELGEGFHWGRGARMRFGQGSRIGRYAYVGNGFESEGPVVVGDLCMIAAGCKIVGADHTFDTVGCPTRLGFPQDVRPVTIFELDCWVGRDVLIMEGVTIGAGAVVGSGSLVTRDIAPYTIAGGVPAKAIRSRFAQDEAARHHVSITQGGKDNSTND